MRRVTIISALSALLLMIAAPAFAQDYPPVEVASCTIDTTTVSPGGTVSVDCAGWAANTTVEVTVDGEVLGTAQTDGDGNLAVDVTLPSDLDPGEHTLRLSGTNAQGEQQNVDIAFTVAGAAADGRGQPAAPGAAAGLPATGKDSVLFGVLALGLFTAGGGALYAARRRNAGLTQS